jgi:hypothetical protein
VTVTDQTNGAPVENAMVWLVGVENMGRTDAQGRTQLMAPLQTGEEQTLVVTPVQDKIPYKESRYRITVPDLVSQEYNLVVSSDRPMTFDHGQEVPTPEFNPAPQRVSANKIQQGNGWRQVHAMRYAHSAWMDGEGQDDGFWEPFYVWTGSDPDHPVIGTYLLNGSKRWNAVYDCPRSVGVLTITGIDESGTLVSFTSTSGVNGTFHLITHRWQFS